MMFLIKNLNLFLDKKLKIHFFIYFICLFVASFLETIGISIIPIIISLHLKEGFFYENINKKAITIINTFSIRVASVIGRFSVVPRHAHFIDLLSKSV